MPTLPDRLQEVMSAMGWDRGDLMRVSQQSSSVVSQWLGKASKPIQAIGKLEAALYIERASGFSALWVAKGMGPKRIAAAGSGAPHSRGRPEVADVARSYDAIGLDAALDTLSGALARLDSNSRDAVAANLAGWAKAGGGQPWRGVLGGLLHASPETKRQLGAA